MNKKILTIGSIIACIIILLAGLSPVVGYNTNISQGENQNITITISGLGKQESQSLELSKEKYTQLENTVNEIKIKFENAKTKEESLIVYNKAIDTLYELGILKESYKKMLIRITYLYSLISKLSTKINLNPSDGNLQESMSNQLCLIIGGGINIFFITPLFYLDILAGIIFEPGGPELFLTLLGLFRSVISPVHIGSFITCGSYSEPLAQISPKWNPASGWIKTIGIKGYQQFQGESFYGQFDGIDLPDPAGIWILYPGAVGFSGIRVIFPSQHKHFFIGFALSVSVGSEHP